MQRYKSTYTGPQMDVAFERALPGGAIDQSMSAKLDWEGLINPEFTVAQAGIGGNHGSVPYAADCWKLVSGTVSAAPGGGLVLNGVIRQTLETAAGLDVVASINVTGGTATAAYDDATRQFDITSSGGTIKRAHLGKTGIEDWSKMPKENYNDTLNRSRRYYERGIITIGLSGRTDAYALTDGIQFKAEKRTSASVWLLNPHNGNVGSVYDAGNGNSYKANVDGGTTEFSIVFTETGFSAFDAMQVGYEAIADL